MRSVANMDTNRIDHRPPKHLRTLKKGDVRADGMIFLQYNQTCKDGGQRWVTREKFDEMQAKVSTIDNRPAPHLRTLKQGDVRADGMIFWGYKPTSKNGERWMTREKFKERREKKNARRRERAATDPEYREKANAYHRTPEARERSNARRREKYANDPVYRERVRCRDAAHRIDKAGKVDLTILGLRTKEEAKEAKQGLERIYRKHFGDTKAELDHKHSLNAGNTVEAVRNLGHFTNLALIPATANKVKHDRPFWKWFATIDDKLRDCLIEQDEFNRKMHQQILSL